MSRPVDVLALIEACWGKDSDEYAAVAELIDKADNAATALSNLIAAGQVDAGYSVYVTDLTAALARVHPMTREQQAEQAGVRG